MKSKGFIKMLGLALLIAVSCIGCLGIPTAKIADMPPESAEPTPLEGAWSGETELLGTRMEYQFKGNTYVAKAINGKNVTWNKGIFTLTGDIFQTYQLYEYNPQSVRDGHQFRWIKFEESDSAVLVSDGETISQTLKYSFSPEGKLVFGEKDTYVKLESGVKMPEDYVFFLNENNAAASQKGDNPYLFTIEKINDVDFDSVNIPFVMSGFAAAEQRDPGMHKISFRQKYGYTENNRTIENDVEGYFSRNFEPGVYSFSLYTPEHKVFMPANLPDIPAGNTRVVIIRTEIGAAKKLYDYLDISTATKR
jgi:hypothetical protein